MIFALCVMVLAIMVAGAIDFRRAEATKLTLQTSLDSAVLAAARAHSIDPDMTVGQAKEIAAAYFSENVVNASYGYQLNSFNLVFDEEAATYSGSIKGELPTSMLGLAGINTTKLDVESEVTLSPPDNLEVMLVLDNTQSMQGQKIADLKDSAAVLIDTLLEDDPENVKVGIVPFAEYVNVGLASRNEPWIDVPSDYSTDQKNCHDTYPNATPTGNFETVSVNESYDCRKVSYSCTQDGLPATCERSECRTRTVQQEREIYDMGNPVQVCSTATSNYEWRGCVGSRSYPFNKRDYSYGPKPIPGLLNENCPAEILPLTNQHSAVSGKLNSLFVSGNTYSPAGLMWGLRALSPDAPLQGAIPFQTNGNADGVKAMVFMTDGVNTLSQNGKKHNGNNRKDSDRLTIEICDAVKEEGVRLFTIAFELPDNEAKKLLEDCATDAGSFFDATDKSALDDAFKEISNNLIEIHISR